MTEGNMEFRKVPIDQNQRGLKRKLSMIQSFASALASRNVNNKKINKPIKQLRVLSCFGNQQSGGVLPPCEHLMDSDVQEGKNYCGACGCGDKSRTWLIQEADEYSKLDYPKVGCPLQMPGFSIENMEYTDVQKVYVKIGEAPEPPKETPKTNS